SFPRRMLRASHAPARARLSLLPSGPGEVHEVTSRERRLQAYMRRLPSHQRQVVTDVGARPTRRYSSIRDTIAERNPTARQLHESLRIAFNDVGRGAAC